MIQKSFNFSLSTKIYLTKILGLDICADTLVGDEMLKGISGGQKKRLTTGLILLSFGYEKSRQIHAC